MREKWFLLGFIREDLERAGIRDVCESYVGFLQVIIERKRVYWNEYVCDATKTEILVEFKVMNSLMRRWFSMSKKKWNITGTIVKVYKLLAKELDISQKM